MGSFDLDGNFHPADVSKMPAQMKPPVTRNKDASGGSRLRRWFDNLSPGKKFSVVLAGLFASQVLIGAGKLICYETYGRAGALRELVGDEVVFTQGDEEHQGFLKSARYRYNDTLGWFDLEITVRMVSPGFSAYYSFRLPPGEAAKVRPVSSYR